MEKKERKKGKRISLTLIAVQFILISILAQLFDPPSFSSRDLRFHFIFLARAKPGLTPFYDFIYIKGRVTNERTHPAGRRSTAPR